MRWPARVLCALAIAGCAHAPMTSPDFAPPLDRELASIVEDAQCPLASLSIVVASSVGGILIDAFGFWAIGIFCFVCALTSMVVVLLFVKEEPIGVEFAPL